jgi:radical SAM protein with 4Fe4S-binding SPASM domain
MCHFVEHNTNVEMSINNLIDILEQASRILLFGQRVNCIRLDGNGEALLYKDLKRAITEVKKRFPFCYLITNGTILSEKMAYDILSARITYISISITGTSPLVYKNFQGYGMDIKQAEKQFNKVVSNVERFAWLNKNKFDGYVGLQINYLLTEESLHEAAAAAYFWKSKGVSSINYRSLNSGLGKNKEVFDRYSQSTEFRSINTCFNTLSIFSNGDCAVCCNDALRTTVMGNVFKDSLNVILNSENYRKFVDNITKFNMKQLPESCQKCDLIRL